VPEVAKLVRVTTMKVLRWIHCGELSATREVEAMNNDVVCDFNEYLRLTGDKAAAISLTLAAALRECSLGPPAATRPSGNVLTVAEAATRLKVAQNTGHRLVERGELRHHRIGRTIRILPTDIDAYQRLAAEAARRQPAGEYHFDL
jgi:excisionase family DNA binding protein